MDEKKLKAALEALPKEELVNRLLRWERRRYDAEEYLLDQPGPRGERAAGALDILIEPGWRHTRYARQDAQVYFGVEQELRDGVALKDALETVAEALGIEPDSAKRMYYREKERRP